ncbi:MAG: ABC transporter substrate-binding protein [Eubacterium sp.]
MKKLISILMCILLVGLTLSGCGSKEESYDFIYPFSADVRSYDPQVAGTSDEYLIIENTFEGLIRINDKGEIQPGVAESWDISSDRLTYTFKLQKGLKWNINTEKNDKGEFKDERLQAMGKEFNPDITAEDFVFALRRAADPQTNCPLFSSIACIANATAIHEGRLDTSALGVTALDRYTLEINLSHPDDSFMQTLTSAVAMPCNSEFFQFTKGRYGLDTKYSLFNGQFYVSQILERSYLLKANKYYMGPAPTKAKELTLRIVDDNSDSAEEIKKLKDGYYDAAFITGTEYDALKNSKGITYSPYTDTTWAFVFNTNDEIFQSKTMRKAFCQGFKRIEKSDKEYLSNATNLIPKSCEINSNNAVKAIGSTIEPQNKDKSVESWLKAVDVLGTTEISVTVLTPEEMSDSVKEMLQGIQSGLGKALRAKNGDAISLTLKVEVMTQKEIKSAIRTNEYDIAFLPFKSSAISAVSFIEGFANDSIGDFNREKVLKNVSTAQRKFNLNDISKALADAESEIIKSYSVCPMIYESSYYAAADGVNNVQFHAGTGRVSFVNATRDK